jgi:uncharacterized protein YcfJ
MRFRVGLAVGFATGYVLGTKAGRERYEQIVGTAGRVMGSQQGQRLAETANRVVEKVEERAANFIGTDEPELREREATVPTRGDGGNGKI